MSQPCPELGKSDPHPTAPRRTEIALTIANPLQMTPFKTGRPWPPQGWKVRFLRRSALGNPGLERDWGLCVEG